MKFRSNAGELYNLNGFSDCGKPSGIFFFPIKDFSSRNRNLSNEIKIIVLTFLEQLACEMRLFHSAFKHSISF